MTTYSVIYRHRGKQTSKTLRVKKDAENLRDLMNNPLIGVDKALEMVLGRGAPAASVLTVDELATRFFDWKAGKVTDRTIRDYRRDYANHIAPTFGAKAAEVVDEAAVQEWVDAMDKRGASPKSIADRHMILHSIYKYGRARSRRLVTHNPCDETELAKPGKKRPKGTTVSEWRSILAAAHQRNADAEDLIRYLGTVGWRWSEGAALPVKAVEVRRGGVVWVDMTQVFRMVENRQTLVPDASKSFAGFRCVPVPNDDTAAMLLRRLVGKGPDDFVFTNTRGNHWNQQTFLRDTWPAILRDADLWKGTHKSPTPHWLRHMAVAVLIAGGASIQEVQRYIGHEDISTTVGTYGGLLGGLSDDVLSRVNEILQGLGTSGHVVLGEVVTPAGDRPYRELARMSPV